MTSWHAFDLITGRRGPQLATRTRGTVSRVLCEPTDTQLDVRTWDHTRQRSHAGWEEATRAMRSLIVLLDDDENVLWGGIVLRRTMTTDTWATLMLATCEEYLDRRYTGDLQYANTEQTSIAAGLIGVANLDGINLTIDATGDNTRRDRRYRDEDDKTILACLQALNGIRNGIEFTVDLEWADSSRTRLKKVARIRPRIGRWQNPTTWTFPGPVTGLELIEDFTDGNFANDVMATSSGEGDTRPESAHVVDTEAVLAGMPKVERRFTPSTSITNLSTLDGHARREYNAVRRGLTQASIKTNLTAAPRLNVDWWLGDDINVEITSPTHPARIDADGRHRAGWETTLRVVGWQLDLDANELIPITQAAS